MPATHIPGLRSPYDTVGGIVQFGRMLDKIRLHAAGKLPAAWVEAALQNQDVMLIDHGNCEKKAAGAAFQLMFRYIDKPDLQNKMSRLAREELRHFEQVLAIIRKRDIALRNVGSSRYAAGLRELVRNHEPYRLTDTLVIGAFIEARSCERFAMLVPHLDEELAQVAVHYYLDEMTHAEIADILGCSRRQVGYLLERLSTKTERLKEAAP